MSKYNESIKIAYERGYRWMDGKIVSPSGKELKLYCRKESYPRFGIRVSGKQRCIVAHRFAAFQKFGEIIFMKGVEVRHLNGNRLDLSDQNISIGDSKANHQDIPREIRMRTALIAASYITKHDHVRIRNMHSSGMSYSEIMKETGITSKGTISFIVSGRKKKQAA
jgi:hypothetical protein